MLNSKMFAKYLSILRPEGNCGCRGAGQLRRAIKSTVLLLVIKRHISTGCGETQRRKCARRLPRCVCRRAVCKGVCATYARVAVLYGLRRQIYECAQEANKISNFCAMPFSLLLQFSYLYFLLCTLFIVVAVYVSAASDCLLLGSWLCVAPRRPKSPNTQTQPHTSANTSGFFVNAARRGSFLASNENFKCQMVICCKCLKTHKPSATPLLFGFALARTNFLAAGEMPQKRVFCPSAYFFACV